jgi:peptidoglycan hydrolase-like protein with peptidoglycan-binding domain
MKTRFIPAGLIAAALLAGPAFAADATPASAAAPAHAAAAQTTAAKPAAVHANNAGLYRQAQQKLKDMNLYSGAVDGTRNAAYVTSLQGFQRDHHIPATGRLNHATRTALGIAA